MLTQLKCWLPFYKTLVFKCDKKVTSQPFGAYGLEFCNKSSVLGPTLHNLFTVNISKLSPTMLVLFTAVPLYMKVTVVVLSPSGRPELFVGTLHSALDPIITDWTWNIYQKTTHFPPWRWNNRCQYFPEA